MKQSKLSFHIIILHINLFLRIKRLKNLLRQTCICPKDLFYDRRLKCFCPCKRFLKDVKFFICCKCFFFVVGTCQRGCKAFLSVSACMHIMERGLERRIPIRQKKCFDHFISNVYCLSFITRHKHTPTCSTHPKNQPPHQPKEKFYHLLTL